MVVITNNVTILFNLDGNIRAVYQNEKIVVKMAFLGGNMLTFLGAAVVC